MSVELKERSDGRRREARREEDQNKEIDKEKVLLLKHSLLSSNYQDRRQKINLRQFLNRVVMLMQEPVVITILHKQDNKTDYRVMYHTMHDPVWQTNFEAKLASLGQVENNFIYLSEDNEEYLFPIRDELYLMMFRMDFDNPENDNLPEFKGVVTSDDSHCISALLKALNTVRLGEVIVSNKLRRYMSKYWSLWSDGHLVTRRDEKRNRELIKLDQEDAKDFFDYQYKNISKVFNEQYEQIKESPLLCKNPYQPPNIMFAICYFDWKKARFHSESKSGHYTHSVRGLVPDSQKEDIINALETLRLLQEVPSKKKNDKVFHFPAYQTSSIENHVKDTSENIPDKCQPNKHCSGDSQFFWDLVNSNRSFQEIFDVIEKPYSMHARSLSDIVFSGGFVRIAPNPYTKTAKFRLEEVEAQKGSESEDYKRMVYYHYLLSMASSGSGDLSVLMVPGHINGCPWFTMAFSFSKEENESHRQAHARWIECFHFYHSIAHYFIRGIRSKIKRLYLEEASSFFLDCLTGLDASSLTILDDWLSMYRNILSTHFEVLCRIYPFQEISLSILGGEYYLDSTLADDEVVAVHIGKFDLYLKVELIDNIYYQPNTDGKYLTAVDVASKLNATISKIYQNPHDFVQ